MIAQICATCDKEFQKYPSQKRRFCSLACVPVNLGNAARWVDKIPVQLICQKCSTPFSVRPSRAKRAKFCSFTCKQSGAAQIASQVLAKKLRGTGEGKAYPKLNGRHAHRVIAEKKIGRALLPGEVVHHKDENKLNYSEDNLEVLPSQSEHAKLHVYNMLEKRKQNRGY